MDVIPASRPHQQDAVRRARISRSRPAVVGLALLLPAPAVAQDGLATARIDSLMTIATDRMQSAALAAAREDVDAILEANYGLFGYGGVFADVLDALADSDCSRGPSWVRNMAQHLFITTERLALALERSTDGEMDRWPAGPELILDDLEFLQETWDEIKDENREYCGGVDADRSERVTDGPICAGDGSFEACWIEISNQPGCFLWNPFPVDDEYVMWSGECSNGLAQGVGRTSWYENNELSQTWESRNEDGRPDGWAVGRGFGDDAFQSEGCYVNGDRQGRWTERWAETLLAGRYWEWTFSLSAGERIVANMESDEIDSYLRVLRDDGTEIASDDDGGSGVNARIEFTVPVTGQYDIRASAYDDDDSGSFVLWVGDRDHDTTRPGEVCPE